MIRQCLIVGESCRPGIALNGIGKFASWEIRTNRIAFHAIESFVGAGAQGVDLVPGAIPDLLVGPNVIIASSHLVVITAVVVV